MRYLVAIALGVALAAPWTAVGQALPPLVRPALDFRLRDATSLNGELLAAERDSLWILRPGGGVNVVPLSAVSGIRTRQRGMTAGGVFLWSLIGGAISGGALAAACSSVDGAENCGVVVPATLLAWVVVGGLAAAVTSSGSRSVHLEVDAIRPYARFPQGLPAGFFRTDVTPPASAPRDSVPH